MALFALSLLFGSNLGWFGLAYFCLGGLRLTSSVTPALGRTIVAECNLGLAFGALEAVSDGSLILSPILAGELYKTNPQLIFIISAIGILVSLVIYAGFLGRVYPGAVRQKQASLESSVT